MTGSGGLIEVQGTAEGAPFSRAELDRLLDLAAGGIERVKAGVTFTVREGATIVGYGTVLSDAQPIIPTDLSRKAAPDR